MSYDINLDDPKTGETIQFGESHDMRGGTYALGGTSDAWLNVTYNYSGIFRRVIDQEKGIRKLYGMTGAESIPILETAISLLNTDEDPDYWAATEGNARKALMNLLTFARVRPDGVWSGD